MSDKNCDGGEAHRNAEINELLDLLGPTIDGLEDKYAQSDICAALVTIAYDITSEADNELAAVAKLSHFITQTLFQMSTDLNDMPEEEDGG